MPKPASIELGPYQLLERIGEGGSGQVYRARGPAGPIAIKLLGPASDMDDAARARFGREIGALGQIAHPHLVAMLDHGVDAELGPYLVLPLLAGANLRELAGGRAMCPEAALLLALPIVEATAALHAAGYVHRDLKPENVIAGPDGSITVIDLGLAWREGMTRHTDTGTAVGSVGYMAPEQIEGRTVDIRADVWALGVIIYEWIVGKRPFARGRPAEEAAAMLLGTCPRLTAADRRTGEALADLVARCLAVDPAGRPRAAELASALRDMIDWTDDVAAERAAVVADPAAYQARIAPFRIRRVERLAREALAAGKPFVALAHCDRGLAYSADHPQLLALVAEAEAATGSRGAPTPADAPQVDVVDSGKAPVQTAQTPTPAVAASQPSRRFAKKWPWLVGAGLVLWISVITIYVVIPDKPAAPSTQTTVTHSSIDDRDRKLVGDLVDVLGQAVTNVPGKPPPPRTGTPATAAGWMELAATQPPAEAVASIRQALALSPTWVDAQIALCAALAAAKDAGALAACDVAVKRRPDHVAARAARGAAQLQAGNAAAALIDLDRAVAGDPDPKWRRLRASARSANGDKAGAKKDLEHACQLGDAAACSEQP